jgi:predicted regulator of Ras-like GTPase activity (Roadblock/LC7/MglB family)
MTDEERARGVLAELSRLRESVTGVRGCVVAGSDGLLFLHDLSSGPEPHDLAALAAAAVGVGRQTSRALRHGSFRETTIHGDRGYFAVYTIGEAALLAVVGADGMNVARLHLEVKAIMPRLVELLPGNPVSSML